MSRFDRPGKGYLFKNAETYLWKYAPQNNLRKISNTYQRYSKYYITYNINMKEVPRRRNEGTKRTSMERMWCGGVSFQCSFLLLLMVWSYINDSIPTNTNIEQMYVGMRASIENFGIFTFLNCYFFQHFVGTLKISHGLISLGGGGQAPPPPHQYATETNGTGTGSHKDHIPISIYGNVLVYLSFSLMVF